MIPRGGKVYVALNPIDLRWGFDRLCGIVQERLVRTARSGARTLLAVDIPQTVNCLALTQYLYDKHMSGVIEYEEASVSAVHLAQRNLPVPKT